VTATRSTITAIRSAKSLVNKTPMELIQIGAEVDPAWSGGPVCRQDSGAVIGVMTGGTSGAPQGKLSLAVPVQNVFALAKAVREAKAAGRNRTVLKGTAAEVLTQELIDTPVPEDTELEIPSMSLPGGGLHVRAEGGQLLADPQRPRVYVTEKELNALTVINVDESRIEKRLSVGPAPVGMGLSPDNASLYVALSEGNQITVVDLESLAVTRIVQIRSQPFDVACPAKGKLYVSPASDSRQVRARLVDFEENVCVTFGWPGELQRNALAVTRPESTAAFFGRTAGHMRIHRCDHSVDSLKLERLMDNLSGNDIDDMKFSADGKRLYMAGCHSDCIQILDPDTLSLIGKLDTCEYAERVAPAPDGLRVYAVHGRNHVDAFDAKTFLKIGSFGASGAVPINVAVSADSRKLVVAFPHGIWIRSVEDMGPVAKDW